MLLLLNCSLFSHQYLRFELVPRCCAALDANEEEHKKCISQPEIFDITRRLSDVISIIFNSSNSIVFLICLVVNSEKEARGSREQEEGNKIQIKGE
jgi:hypothetical protein